MLNQQTQAALFTVNNKLFYNSLSIDTHQFLFMLLNDTRWQKLVYWLLSIYERSSFETLIIEGEYVPIQ